MRWGKVEFKTSDVPVTNLRNFFKSSTNRVVMKVFSIWYTQSSLPSLSDESWKYRPLITNSFVSPPWWTNNYSNNPGLCSISAKMPRVERPFLNWSRIDFLFTRMSWNISDCQAANVHISYCQAANVKEFHSKLEDTPR